MLVLLETARNMNRLEDNGKRTIALIIQIWEPLHCADACWQRCAWAHPRPRRLVLLDHPPNCGICPPVTPQSPGALSLEGPFAASWLLACPSWSSLLVPEPSSTVTGVFSGWGVNQVFLNFSMRSSLLVFWEDRRIFEKDDLPWHRPS